jgi:hypothetical protein
MAEMAVKLARLDGTSVSRVLVQQGLARGDTRILENR